MPKSPDAFRTISEVADWLGVQAHVLRFWESKFSQVKPIKRAGGRRYYRPADMLLIGGLKKLLHEDGLTIKGAQKLLREKGVSYVAEMSQPLDELTSAVIEGTASEIEDAALPDVADEAQVAEVDEPLSASDAAGSQPLEQTQEDASSQQQAVAEALLTPQASDPESVEVETEPPLETVAAGTAIEDSERDASGADTHATPEEAAARAEEEETASDADAPLPQFRARHRDHIVPETPPQEELEDTEPQSPAETVAETQESAPVPEEPIAETVLKPKIVDLPPVPAPDEIEVGPSALSALAGLRSLTAQEAREIKPFLARLTRLHASMARSRKDIGKD